MTSAQTHDDDDDRRASLIALSALRDGEAAGDDGDRACTAWRQEASLREAWHTWSLVGDVMRSDDLAQSASHDAAFLNRLRQRLTEEPAVLAPAASDRSASVVRPLLAPVAANRGRLSLVRRRWTGPAAVAAGFVAVAGALVVLRTGVPGAAPAEGLQASTATTAPAVAGPAALASGGPVLVQNPDLERYLAAHRQFAQGPALAAPGGVRQVVASPNGR